MSKEIVERIAEFEPEDGEWIELDELIQDLVDYDLNSSDFERLFCLFERFPEDDGAEVFWALVHFLEDIGGYEKALVRSLRSKPSDMATIMVNRMLNGGIQSVGETKLMELLVEIAGNSCAPDSVRKRAEHFIDYQNGKAEPTG